MSRIDPLTMEEKIMFVKQLFGRQPKQEENTDDMVFAPFSMEYTNPIDNSSIEVIANPGWAPFKDHLYIHEVLTNNQNTRVTNVKMLKLVFETVKEDLQTNHPEIEGIYIKSRLFDRAEDMWQSEGFSKERQAMPGSAPVHVCNFANVEVQ